MADAQITYRTWGEQFFASAISEGRILGAVDALAGQPIDVGPIGVGPGRFAKVRAYGSIGNAQAQRVETDDPHAPIRFAVRLPVHVSFEVDLGVEVQRFDADLTVPLALTALALDGVRIFVEVDPPRAEAIEVTVTAQTRRASLVQRIANIEGELQRFVARYVARELAKPHVAAARLIDVGAMIDKAWESLKPEPAPAEGVVADLNEALGAEIREREEWARR